MEIRTIRVSSKRQITIPKSFTAVQEGDQILLVNEGDKIVIRPLPKNISETAFLSEAALAECWNSPEDDKAFRYLQ